MANIPGTDAGETLDGTALTDLITAAGGDDTLNGLDDFDQLFGELGNDTLNGGAGNDFLVGGEGHDSIYGGDGSDALQGGFRVVTTPSGGLQFEFTPATQFAGDDLFDGGAGFDSVNFSTGTVGVTVDLRISGPQDTGYGLDSFISVEAVTGTAVADTLNGTDEANALSGWIDTARSGNNNDTIRAWGGNDLISAGYGTNLVDGGSGADAFYMLHSYRDPVTNQTVGGTQISLLLQGVQQDTGAGMLTLTNVENLAGWNYADELTGDHNANVILGGDGADEINGNGGNDTIRGDSNFGADSGGWTIVAFTSGQASVSRADILSGGDGDDTIYGEDGNDEISGNAGNDTLIGGTGIDKLYGGDDDDVLNDVDIGTGTPIIDGGTGNDTLEVSGTTLLFGATLTSIETIGFLDGPAGTINQVFVPFGTVASAGITGLEGSNAIDRFAMIIGTAGTYTMPDFTLTDWTYASNYSDPAGGVYLIGNGNVDLTLNARDDFASLQVLFGGSGNDTLNGGNGREVLDGAGGVNHLFGNGGDDYLALVNVTPVIGSPILPNFDGTGSTYDGGTGFDMFGVGGYVHFQGTLTDIEAIFLQPTVGTPGAGGYQPDTYLEMSLAKFAMLPDDFTVYGAGQMAPTLGYGESFDFSAVQFDANATASFFFAIYTEVDGGTPQDVTWIGSSRGDYFYFSYDAITVTGGGGFDIFEFEDAYSSLVTITDFTVNVDKIDIGDFDELYTFAQLRNFMSQVGANTVIAYSETDNGETVTAQLVLEGVQMATLTANDFLIASGDGGSSSEPARADFSGDIQSDILWRNADGLLTYWEKTDTGFSTATPVLAVSTDWQVAGSGDFNFDGAADILWRNTNGAVTYWTSNTNGFDAASFYAPVSSDWQIAGTGDFTGDGYDDVLWRNSSGGVTFWAGGASGLNGDTGVFEFVDTAWQVAGTGDFNGDGLADIAWRNADGGFTMWNGTGTGFAASSFYALVGNDWAVAGTGDFNGDGMDDVLWRNSGGGLTYWAGTLSGFDADTGIFESVGTDWHVAAIGDYGADGTDGILWRNDAGGVTLWYSNPLGFTAAPDYYSGVPAGWEILDV